MTFTKDHRYNEGYYTNVRYPSGAYGHIARGVNGGWAVTCHPDLGEYPTRVEAAEAERAKIWRNA